MRSVDVSVILMVRSVHAVSGCECNLDGAIKMSQTAVSLEAPSATDQCIINFHQLLLIHSISTSSTIHGATPD